MKKSLIIFATSAFVYPLGLTSSFADCITVSQECAIATKSVKHTKPANKNADCKFFNLTCRKALNSCCNDAPMLNEVATLLQEGAKHCGG